MRRNLLIRTHQDSLTQVIGQGLDFEVHLFLNLVSYKILY